MEIKKNIADNPEIILSDEDLGVVISEDLSSYLRKYTGKDDRAQVFKSTGVGLSTLRNIVFRTNTVTKYSYPGLVALIDIAVKNCEETLSEANQALVYFKDKLITEKAS